MNLQIPEHNWQKWDWGSRGERHDLSPTFSL